MTKYCHSTERRNRNSIPRKKISNLCRIPRVISPISRNGKKEKCTKKNPIHFRKPDFIN